MKHYLLLIAVLLSLPALVFSQQTKAHTDSLSAKEESSYFKIDVNYLTNNVYNGRKDSLRVPYLTPTIGYYHKSGLYAEASTSLLLSNYAAVRPDLSIIDAGYNYNKGGNFSGSLSASKYFVNSQSVSVKSQLRGSVDASASYNIHDYVTLNGGASYLLTAAKPDILLNAGISHEWDWGSDDDWSVAPAVTANFGTQNYFDSYQQQRTRKTGGKKKSNVTGTTTDVTVSSLNPGRFALLDYEFSAPLYYDTKKWGAYLIPTFAVPESPDTYAVMSTSVRHNLDGSSDAPIVRNYQTTEHLTNSFYAQVGVYFVIK